MNYEVSLNKKHDYLICIDSDGTVLDTMVLKHKEALGLALIEVFNLEDKKEEVLNEWVRINCFSETRGLNRFITLKYMFSYLENIGYKIKDLDNYNNWVLNTNSLSVLSLEKEIEKVKNNSCLKLVYDWALECNKKIALLREPEEFKNATRIIKLIDDADLVGISTANNKALVKEWTNAKIIDRFSLVASQEYGTKEYVINKLLSFGYDKKRVIMIGDSKGDMLAAKNNDVYFYPVIPGKEDLSWELFYNKYYKLFINDEFNKEIEEELITNFLNSLTK